MNIELTVKGDSGDYRMTFMMCDVDKSDQVVTVAISEIAKPADGEFWETCFDLDLVSSQTLRDALDFLIATQTRRANP